MKHQATIYLFVVIITAVISCKPKNTVPSAELISGINLKRGSLVSCGPADKQFGEVNFELSCGEKIKPDFNLAMSLLHSFEYDEAEKVFAKIIDTEPGCAMAYWGIAMSNFHPLWTPPAEAELIKGNKAIELAAGIAGKTAREAAYIHATATFYKDWKTVDHITRCRHFEQSMEKVYTAFPGDTEAALFYALALNAAASPSDKTYTKQKKAATILDSLYQGNPDHPGIIHYMIHTYDYPELAALALPAARKYAGIAPSSAHALHMPSHIFTRLGLWDEAIASNRQSVDAAKCYATAAGINGHWDEELHGLDYLVYGYLQKGDNKNADELVQYLQTIKVAEPLNFKVAYAFAAIPCRYVLENKEWNKAAAIQVPAGINWQQFPWQEAILHFTRLLGAVHEANTENAKTELQKLRAIHDTLQHIKDAYKTTQVAVQLKTGEAWLLLAAGDKTGALKLMQTAADMEDSTGKHPVTPGEVIPARELLADMLLQTRQYANALDEYEAALKKSPNRFNSLHGAATAAEKSGNKEKATYYFTRLLSTAPTAQRAELTQARLYLKHS